MSKRKKRKIKRIVAWTAVYLFEIFVAAVPTVITAAILVPAALRERGYFAIGGEWIAVGIVFYTSYAIIHNAVCDAIFGKEA